MNRNAKLIILKVITSKYFLILHFKYNYNYNYTNESSKHLKNLRNFCYFNSKLF